MKVIIVHAKDVPTYVFVDHIAWMEQYRINNMFNTMMYTDSGDTIGCSETVDQILKLIKDAKP